MSFFSVYRTILPFDTILEMYYNSDFRLVLVPNTASEDDFKYSADPLLQIIYEERIEPYLEEFDKFQKNLSHLDSQTVLYLPFLYIR